MSALFNEILVFPQIDGTRLEIRVVCGDEYYACHETKDGYSVVYDYNKETFCYMTLVDGQCASSGIPASKCPPKGLRKHLREFPKIRQQKFKRRFAELRKSEAKSTPSTFFAKAPENGLLSGRRISEGNVRGLTILVEFQNVSSDITLGDVDDFLNGDDYSRNGNFSSVKEYFKRVSNGNLTYTHKVIGPVLLDNNQSHYHGTLLVEEALDKAIEQFGLDLSEFDSRNEGVVDAINFFYAGESLFLDHNSWLWPHNSVKVLQHGNIRTHFYMLTGMGRSPVDLSIGTFCHETGHLLCRFPDMYDYGFRDQDFADSAGIGAYCLMGSGNYLDRGLTPSPVCSYLRDLVEWAPEKITLNSPGQYEATHGDYGKIMKFKTDKPNEYFIVENRFQKDLDEHLPSSGLAVYHCDILGSNEWQFGTEDRHYQCALLQADGRRDLENNRNQGDDGDLFNEFNGETLSHDSSPSTRIWDGSDSGLMISNITASDSVIQFNVGRVVQGTIARGEVIADLIIPDNEPNGVDSTLILEETGKVKSLKVFVDVSHTWISDLQVSLISPSGKSALLHDKEGGSGDDIQTTYTTDSSPALQDITGETIKGQWTLHILDTAFQDIGRLNKWSIEIEYATEGMIAEGVSSKVVEIPDNNTQGVSSGIAIGESGQSENITVEVEITHTYIGDLLVELLSPSGHAAVLHDQEGYGEDDLKMTYDNFNTPSLQALLNQNIQGTWQLWIKDLAGVDIGKLERWSLRIGYSKDTDQAPPDSSAKEKGKPEYSTKAKGKRSRV